VTELLLAVDVGTTGVRAGAFDAGGRLLAEASEPCPHRAAAPGWAEADAEAWWTAVRALLARVGASVALDRAAAIAVVGQAPTAVLVDGAGRAMRPALLWLDVRADAEARAVAAALGPGRAEAIGGNRVHPYFLGPKVAWLRAHEPETLDACALLLQSHAFVVMRLTGEAACDPSAAMLCAPMFDARLKQWSAEGARAVGFDVRKLPRIAGAHAVIGAVTREAAAATGLRQGTPVVGGGGDFAACALGAGAIDEGEACLMLGTSGNILVPTASSGFDVRLIHSHHVGCDRWLALGGTLCGAALTWFKGVFGAGASWEELEREAANIAVGAEGLLVVPYLQGERTPIWNESARGAVFGLDLTHGRGHVYRAMLEGIALGFRHCAVVLEESGVKLTDVVAANGAGRSPLLRQTLCDALGAPLAWTRGAGGTLAGAAILAGLGAGVLADASVARAWRGEPVRHTPDARAHAALAAVFERRLSLYEAIASSSARA
jgi:sugar (pentulose or hexulose) kinase